MIQPHNSKIEEIGFTDDRGCSVAMTTSLAGSQWHSHFSNWMRAYASICSKTGDSETRSSFVAKVTGIGYDQERDRETLTLNFDEVYSEIQ